MKLAFRLSAAICMLLALFGAGCAAVTVQNQIITDPNAIRLDEASLRLNFVAESFVYAENYAIQKNAKLFILPHHIVAGKQIAGMLESMPNAKRIILLSPDHFERNVSAFSSTDQPFQYTDKLIENDMKLFTSITEIQGITLDSEIIRKEHGITALLPYLETIFPNATVNPIVVSNDLTAEQAKLLVDWLKAEIMRPDTIVIASIDMSHYLPTEIANFHDEQTMDVIKSLDIDASSKIEIDAPGVMRLLLTLAKETNLGRVEIHNHTNSLILLKAIVSDESTSHLFVSFSPGEPAPPEIHSYLFCQSGIETRENRLYWGQTEVLPPLIGEENACVGLVAQKSVPIKTFILPLEHFESGWRFTKKEDRAKILSDWENSGKLESLDKSAKSFYLNK